MSTQNTISRLKLRPNSGKVSIGSNSVSGAPDQDIQPPTLFLNQQAVKAKRSTLGVSLCGLDIIGGRAFTAMTAPLGKAGPFPFQEGIA